MNSETLIKLRAATATPQFQAARNALRQKLIMTDAIRNVIVETQKIQNQIADVADAGRPWSPTNRRKVDGLLIIGNAGVGKTEAAETAIKLLKPVLVALDHARNPLLLTVPASGTAGALARDIIVGCGLTITREPKEAEAADRVVGNLARHKPALVLIDEASRCASPAIHAQGKIRKESGLMWTIAMSMLDSTVWATPLVLTGLPCLLDSLYLPDSDERTREIRGEASRRFRKIRIPDATIEDDGPYIEAVIAQYCEQLGVSSLLSDDDEIGARLIHASNYAFGTALVIAQQAVALASCRDGRKGKLQRSDFTAIYQFMTGGALAANVFDVSNWSLIDPKVLMPESYNDAIYKEFDDAA